MGEPYDVSYLTPAYEIKVNGTKLEVKNENLITSVTVSKALGQADHFSFEVQDVLVNGKFKWLGDDLFKFGNKVSIAMGYAGKLNHKIEAHIDNISPNFSTGVAPTFKVEGSHQGFALLTEASEYVEWKEKKDSQIVSAIAGTVGLGSDVTDTGESQPDPVKVKTAGKSYWDYIQGLVREHEKFELFVDEGKLCFRASKVGTSPVMTLTWGKHLLSFSTTLDVSKLCSEVVVLSRNGTEDTDIKGQATAGSEKVTKLGSKFGSEIAKEVYKGKKKKYIVKGDIDDKAEADSNARSELEKASSKLITGQGKTLGLPDLKPGVMVELKGLGDWFNGKYYVEKTDHSISSSGYSTSFTAWRNAL
jgi:uncharacterized protein